MSGQFSRDGYVSLHNHTHHSKFDGIPSIAEYVKAAQALDMPAIAITDHGSIEGAKELHGACMEAGIKPIIGCEFYYCDKITIRNKHERLRHIVLIAKDGQGWENLQRLDKIASDHYYNKPRIDSETIAQHHEGLICLTGCTQGVIPQLILANKYDAAEDMIKRFSDVFRDDLYLEVMRHDYSQSQVKANNFLIEYADKHGLQLVASNDVHFIHQKDYDKLGSPRRGFTRHHYLRPYETMAILFSDIPEAINNTIQIAGKCQIINI